MTNVNLGDVVDILDPRPSSTVRQLRSSVYFVVLSSVHFSRCIRGVSLLQFLHPWLLGDPSAIGCVRSFSLLTESLRCGSKEFSKLRKLIRSIVL